MKMTYQIPQISPTSAPPAHVRFYVSPPKVIKTDVYENFGSIDRPETAGPLQSPVYTANTGFSHEQGFCEALASYELHAWK